MAVLVTGGAGFIGSHVVRMLEERGESVVVVDDLSNGKPERVRKSPVVQLDLSSDGARATLEDVIRVHEVRAVIHFASKKRVGESMERPLWYYRQNVVGMVNLVEAMEATNVDTMVFSSSAAVYGMPDKEIIVEPDAGTPINPYGQTKLMGEWLLDDQAAIGKMKAIKLRYFNVAGAGWDDLADTAPFNLIPIILRRHAAGDAPIVFGDDYPTPDGTCVRDYVHVADLADAHLAALDALREDKLVGRAFNVGTGTGASVQEVIDHLGQELHEQLEPVVEARRPGDPPRLVADPTSIAVDMGWKAQFGLKEIVESDVRARQ